MEISKQELQKIKGYLKPEDKASLAERFKLSTGTIRNILNGNNQNAVVLEAAIQVALKNKSDDANRLAAIQKSLSAL